ncbi:MAG: hypothetical protein J6Y22_05915 [Paludibacteraceae bacterium]|nr:hypothetical protein [Paludibacteraceae bacterium]
MKRFAWISQTVSEKSTLRQLNIFTEEEIGYAVRIQFSWTHIRSLSALTDPLARQFYMEMCRIEHWDTRIELPEKSFLYPLYEEAVKGCETVEVIG